MRRCRVPRGYTQRPEPPFLRVAATFSAQPADVSTDTSLRVGMTIGKMSVPDFSKLPKEEQIDYAKKIEFPVRKMAHATEYAILGCLLTNLCLTLPMRKAYMWGWLMGSAYAATDEFHQLFVPGRSGQITDVMLDSVGCLIGCLVTCLILHLVRKHVSFQTC